jgi:long-chain acyl-CoA synthetase
MFIISGFNIYPSNIEEVILSVPGVFQCCVVGKKVPVVGRKIVAYVIGSKNLDKEIRKVCMANLPEFSQPAEIIFLDEFPKTKMNKINYMELESREI